MTRRASDNALLAFAKSYEEATREEFTVTKLCMAIIVLGLVAVAALVVLHLAPAVAML